MTTQRLTSEPLRHLTKLAEAYDWSDQTPHYPDPDCDLRQYWHKGNTEIILTWKGTGVHERLRAVEVRGGIGNRTRPGLRDDGLLRYVEAIPGRPVELAEAILALTDEYTS